MRLRREYVRCKNMKCRACVDGPTHGPYWYAYGRVDGRFTSRYVGKAANLPQAVLKAQVKGIPVNSEQRALLDAIREPSA